MIYLPYLSLLNLFFFVTLCLSLFNFSKASVEAMVKYFVQNVFVAGLSGFGIFIIYFICKSTNIFVVKEAFKVFLYLDYVNSANSDLKQMGFLFFLGVVLFILGILFKIGVFPVHFYVVDIYEISPYPVIFFFSAVVKPTFLFFFVKLVYLIFFPFVSPVFQMFFVFVGLGSV